MLDFDRDAPIRFLQTAFEPNDWIAVFLKAYDTGRVMQRVGPFEMFCQPRWQTWLRAMNVPYRFNVYVSVNALAPSARKRTRHSVIGVRHVFLEADRDGQQVLDAIGTRLDLPTPSYVLQSSPNRVHVFWHVRAFDVAHVERLQKQLASELGTDPAATPCTQTTRLPGFFNVKRAVPHLVNVEYRDTDTLYGPEDFPAPTVPPLVTTTHAHAQPAIRTRTTTDVTERVRRYLAAMPPAIAGQHGDVHTFRVCCRLVRGFALSDAEAIALLGEWNTRCEPPWTERELRDKLQRARRYGHEPVGGLLDTAGGRLGSAPP
jgi:RepB DNA-primase N-terminal domain